MGNSVYLGGGGGVTFPIAFPNGTTLTDSASGKLLITGTVPAVQFGGTTNAFPELAGAGNGLLANYADGTSFCAVELGPLQFGRGALTGALNNQMGWFDAYPTITSGFGTSPSITNGNGTFSFIVNVGTGGTATSGVISMVGSVLNFWVAFCLDITAAAGHTGLRTVMTSATTNSITIESQNSSGVATAWPAGSLVRIIALAG